LPYILNSAEQSKIYRLTIDIIIGVLVAQSFVNAEYSFIPIKKIFEPKGSIEALAVAHAYFIVIIGWSSNYSVAGFP